MAAAEALDARVVQTRRVVLDAVLNELADVGHAAFTIEAVAARCGVGKSTIYRHWRSRSELIADALQTLNPQPEAVDITSHRDHVRQLLSHFAKAVTDGPLAPAIPALIEAAERDESIRARFHEYNAARRRTLRNAITDGIDAGEFTTDTDPELAARALAGAIVYTRLMSPTSATPLDIDSLLSTVLGVRTSQRIDGAPS